MYNAIIAILFFLLSTGPASAESVFEGIVNPARVIEPATPIEGVVSRIFVEEGDSVKKGDMLFKLDDRLQQLEVERRKAILDDRSELEANKKKLSVVSALLDSARTLYRETTSISREELQKLELEAYMVQGKVAELEALEIRQAIEYKMAEELLLRHTLRSPIDGIVTKIDREAGEWVRAGETAVAVVDKEKCHVEFNMDEAAVRTLNRGAEVSIRVGESDETVPGVVSYVSPVADSASGLVKVKVEIGNESGNIIPGVIAKIVLP